MKKFILTLIIIAELLVISATAMLIIENFNQKKQIKKKEALIQEQGNKINSLKSENELLWDSLEKGTIYNKKSEVKNYEQTI